MAISLKAPSDVLVEVRDRFKTRRLAQRLTQEGLARRSGVSFGSVKRFEKTGLIAFESLLKIALALDCLDDFDALASGKGHALEGVMLDDLLAIAKLRKKGRTK